MRSGAVIPVGPGSLELERLRDAVDALRTHVPELDVLVLVDDAPRPRDLGRLIEWDQSRLVELTTPPAPRSPDPHDRMSAGTLTFLAWLAAADRADYLVKLDTDALAIGDFRPSIEAAMRRRPEVAVWGAYRENELGGSPRDFSMYALPLRLARMRMRPRRPFGLEPAITGERGRARRFIRSALAAARANGYETGEHCLGGSYAVTRRAAAAMGEGGWLEDPLATYGTRLGEDMVLGLLARGCGFELASLVGPGEAFAVRFRGLLADPLELVGRGHAIVHSVKEHGGLGERELRSAFRAVRDTAEVK